jgi:hypothetical protein
VAANDTTMPPKVAIKAVPRAYVVGENFELYINHFNRIALANEWPPQAKLAYLETKLSGRAQREFEVFIEEESEISFDDMVKKLIEELVPSSQKALESFTAMRLDDKSPKEFYGALVRQSKLAHGEMDANGRHIVVRTQMLQVLPQRLRQDAAKQGYLADMNKDGFLTILTRVYDAEMRDEVENASYEPTVAYMQKSSATVQDRLESLEKKESQREKDMSELMGMVRNLGKGVPGDQGKSSWRGSGSNQMRGQPGKAVTCFKCLGEGHFARECTNKVKCTKCLE